MQSLNRIMIDIDGVSILDTTSSDFNFYYTLGHGVLPVDKFFRITIALSPDLSKGSESNTIISESVTVQSLPQSPISSFQPIISMIGSSLPEGRDYSYLLAGWSPCMYPHFVHLNPFRVELFPASDSHFLRDYHWKEGENDISDCNHLLSSGGYSFKWASNIMHIWSNLNQTVRSIRNIAFVDHAVISLSGLFHLLPLSCPGSSLLQ